MLLHLLATRNELGFLKDEVPQFRPCLFSFRGCRLHLQSYLMRARDQILWKKAAPNHQGIAHDWFCNFQSWHAHQLGCICQSNSFLDVPTKFRNLWKFQKIQKTFTPRNISKVCNYYRSKRYIHLYVVPARTVYLFFFFSFFFWGADALQFFTECQDTAAVGAFDWFDPLQNS